MIVKTTLPLYTSLHLATSLKQIHLLIGKLVQIQHCPRNGNTELLICAQRQITAFLCGKMINNIIHLMIIVKSGYLLVAFVHINIHEG